MSLHQFANDFLHLLGSDMTDRELEVGLYLEWQKRMVKNVSLSLSKCVQSDMLTYPLQSPALPAPLDSSFPTESRLRRAALDVDFKRNEEKQLVSCSASYAIVYWANWFHREDTRLQDDPRTLDTL